MKILMIGALPPPIGGTSVSFKLLVDELNKSDEATITVLDVTQYRTLKHLVFLPFRLLRDIIKHDKVSLHLGIRALASVGVAAVVISNLLDKEVSIRRFGGQLMKNQAKWEQVLLKFVYKYSQFNFCQTKEQIAELSENAISNVSWFPTCRPTHLRKNQQRSLCKKFVYIGQIKESKGVLMLVKAFNKLKGQTSISLSIYGPFYDNLNKNSLKADSVNYCGVIAPTQIYETMEQYDAIVLPTFYYGEGYPGVLVEAMQLGMPIITTSWLSIPELVEDSAILIQPNSLDELVDAIALLANDSETVKELQRKASNRSTLFSIERQKRIFLDKVLR